jgi:hypothetical protein
VAAPGTTEKGRKLAADGFATAIGQGGWAADQARLLVLVDAGRGSSDAAVVRGDGKRHCRFASAHRVDGTAGR